MSRDTEQIPDHEFRRMVDDLCDIDEGLSPWELEFIESVSHWDGDYTEKQREKIRDLHEKHV